MIAPWLLPVLWREHDWRTALVRLGAQLASVDDGPQPQRAALELGRALEYIEPDRRRAIEVYELAGPLGEARARELAVEVGWWVAKARLDLAARIAEPLIQLVLDECEAWWDAGQPGLAALALAGVRGPERSPRSNDLAALVASRDLVEQLASATLRSASLTGAPAADACVMAARLARAAGKPDECVRSLEAALGAQPGHPVAARQLLDLAIAGGDSERIHRALRARLAGLDETLTIDAMRASAFALIESERHRGFGLRLLRQTLERAYEQQLTAIPGHLAMWTVLAAHAAADGTRRDLLPFAITALQSTQEPIDRVWLGALATEISLRDANHAVVAGAYAEIVAEHAPDHPVVRELVAAVAIAEAEPPRHAVPPAAVAAAAQVYTADIDIDIDLDGVYADAAEAALLLDDGDVIEVAPAPKEQPTISPFATPLRGRSAPAKPLPAAIADKAATAVTAPIELRPDTRPAARPGAAPTEKPSVAPASLAKAGSRSMIPAALTKVRHSIVVKGKAVATTSSIPVIGRMPTVAGTQRNVSDRLPVLQALRTPNRPAVPPKPPDPVDAKERARRIAIPIDVCLIIPGGKRLEGHSRDVSTTGLFVLVTAELAIGIEVGVELLVPGAEAFTEVAYKARARVVRRDQDGYGIVLVRPDAALVAALGKLT